MREEEEMSFVGDKKFEQMSQFYIGRKIWGDVLISKEFIEDSEYNSKLYYTNVQIKDPHKIASLLIVHGFGEHSTRYLETALQFANANYEVHMFDFRGFGYSSGARFMSSLDDFYEDILVVLTKIYKNNPLFILAHSMGAGLILSFLKMNPNLKIAGLVCTNPFIELRHEAGTFLERQIIRRLPKSFDVRLKEIRGKHRIRHSLFDQGQYFHQAGLRRPTTCSFGDNQNDQVAAKTEFGFNAEKR